MAVTGFRLQAGFGLTSGVITEKQPSQRTNSGKTPLSTSLLIVKLSTIVKISISQAVPPKKVRNTEGKPLFQQEKP
ncbi:MAG: hypothetical protein V4614_00730 [Pseudomonadota bacterium]